MIVIRYDYVTIRELFNDAYRSNTYKTDEKYPTPSITLVLKMDLKHSNNTGTIAEKKYATCVHKLEYN
jgi:hypothetical protein